MKIRWQALHIFADVFQCGYKNRTDDYRYFAAFYFILHIINFVVFLLPKFNGPNLQLGWTLFVAVLIIRSLLFALLHPYKKNWLNILDSLILASLGLAALWVLYSIRYKRKVDSVISVHCSATTDVLCYVCSIQTPFMVGNTSEM